MFPESHSHAFAVTAYQAAWLKRYHPVEFFVSLVNRQPMGFYPVETLKQDARRFGVPFLNPCVNRSAVDCIAVAGFGVAGPALRQGRGRGVIGADQWRSGSGKRPLRRGRRPGAVHRPETAGG